jgi:hypothetical protein
MWEHFIENKEGCQEDRRRTQIMNRESFKRDAKIKIIWL